MTDDASPLILTAELPPELHRWATDLRERHFPPERNYLEAHVTLFHALPATIQAELRDVLARVVAESAPIPARLEGLMNLGREPPLSCPARRCSTFARGLPNIFAAC